MNVRLNRRFARFQSVAIVCMAVTLLTNLSGCNSDQLATHPVEGIVRFEDDSVLMFGDIEFFNVEHQVNARGKINRDGTFTVGTYGESDGAVAGKHQIMIMQITGDYLTEKLSDSIKHDHGEIIDSAFFDYRTSGLECTVTPGDNYIELTVRKLEKQTEEGLPEN